MTDQTPAEVIQAQAAQRYQAIRANKDLSAPAVAKQLAQAHTDAKTKLDALQADAKAGTAARQNALSTKLLGIGSNDPSAAISHRDAQDRVAAIPPSDARTPAQMLNRATQSGDTAMQKALLQRGLDHGNQDLVDQYTTANPNQKADVDELWKLNNTPQTNPLLDAFIFAAPKPSEIAGMQDHQIAALANS